MKPTYNRQSGFSIIESIIALAILVLILVLYQTAVNTIALSRESKNQEIATRLANAKIQDLRAAGYDSLPATGSFGDSQLSFLPGGSGTVTVTDISDTSKSVTVTVQWNEPKATTARTISVTTAMASTGGL